MVSYHTAEFGGHRHCGSGDMMFLGSAITVYHIAYHASTHQISRCRHNNLPVCPVKDSRSLSHISTRKTDGIKKRLPAFLLGIRKRKKKEWRSQSFLRYAKHANIKLLQLPNF